MSPRWWVPILWIGLMASGVWFTATRLSVHNELGDLLPEGSTMTQRLLLTQVRSGLSGKLILLAMEGAHPDELASLSKRLGEALRANDRLGFVGNGAQTRSKKEIALLFNSRYLLSQTVTGETFSTSSLRASLEQRLDDLRSPLGAVMKESIPTDPTGEMMGILQSWSGLDAPVKHRGVWMSADRARALLAVETRPAGFDAPPPERTRETAISDMSRCSRCTVIPLKLSAQNEQLGHPSSQSGPYIKW